MVKELIVKKYGIKLSVASVGRLLKKLGLKLSETFNEGVSDRR